MEIKPKTKQWHNMGKPLQGNPKDSFTGTTGKDPKGKDQGPPKKEHILKDSDAPESSKAAKGLRPSRWHKQPSPLALNPLEAHYSVGSDPPMLNTNW